MSSATWMQTRSRGRAVRESGTMWVVVGIGAAVVTGAATARGFGPVIGGLFVLAGACALRRYMSYGLPLVFLLGAVNGIPGVDLTRLAVSGSFHPTDVFVLGLIGLAAVNALRSPLGAFSRLQPWLRYWSPACIAVWCIAWVRALQVGVPALQAALYGRDFLMFALLAPLAVWLFRNEHDLWRFCRLGAIVFGAYGVLFIGATLGVIPPAWVNVTDARPNGSLTRLYAPMQDVFSVVFALSLGWTLLRRDRASRWAAALTVVMAAELALSLTRALYAGVFLGFVVAALVWSLQRGRGSVRLRRRLAGAGAVICIAAVVTAVALPQAVQSSPVQTVVTRVDTGTEQVFGGGDHSDANTFSYRVDLSHAMLHDLGGRWLLGLGFLHPAYHYEADLPDGTIRNTDVGVLNAIMTMGVVGAIMIYVPVLALLGFVLSPRRGGDESTEWIWFGMTVWIVLALVTSPTLVTLFSESGLATTGVVIGLASRALGLRERDRVMADPRAPGDPQASRASVGGHGAGR